MSGKVRRTISTTKKSTGGPLISPLISNDKLQQMYALMLQCRMLTEYAQRLPQRTSSARLYKGAMGQEAIACACTIDLRPEDTLFVGPHDSTARLVKGVPVGELLQELHERPAKDDLKMKFSLALDAATRHKKKKKGNVVLIFADKAMAKRKEWLQTIKMADHAKLPIIFVEENNPWPGPARIRAANHPHYDFPTFSMDANDVVAIYRVVYESLGRLRVDPCPVLLQAHPYRLQHERDPLLHMEHYLETRKLFRAAWKKQVAQQFSRELGSYLRASRAPAND
jgi:TPP-dependent pyruvate/acetoin dehydrogenase alpha subunit